MKGTDQSVYLKGDTASPAADAFGDNAIALAPAARVSFWSGPWPALWIILFGPVMTVIDVFIVNVGLPTIQSFFHTTNAQVQLVVAAYLVGYTVFLVMGSRLGDHFGRKRLFWVGLVLFTLTSAGCGFAATIGQLVFFRLLQGLSAALSVPQAVTLIHLYFPDHKDKNRAFGYYGLSLGVATILGQFLGGYLITVPLIKDSWRLIFLVNLPVGLIATLLAVWRLRESRPEKPGRFDVPGLVLLTAFLGVLIYPLIQGREQGWPAWSFWLLAGAGVLGVWFFLDQRRKSRLDRNPIVHFELFRYRSFSIGVLSLLFFFGVHNSFMLLGSLYFQQALHFSPLAASLFFVVMGASFMVGSFTASRVIGRWGVRVPQGGSLLMLGAVLLQSWFFAAGRVSPVSIVLLFTVYGFGFGYVLPTLVNVTLRDIPASLAGIASGVYSTIQQFSSALGVTIIGGVYFGLIGRTGHWGAYQVALWGMALYLGAGFLLLERFRRKAGNKGNPTGGVVDAGH
jgi:EmrB/QacA subfamily drug resistance transporter